MSNFVRAHPFATIAVLTVTATLIAAGIAAALYRYI